MNNIILPFSFSNQACLILSIINEEDLYDYKDLEDSIKELNNKIINIEHSIKELIVATPNTLFTDNELGTIKDQLDEASADLFSELARTQSKSERLYILKDFIDTIAAANEKTCKETFDLLIHREDNVNDINYRYYKGDQVYDYKTMDVFDRNVGDIYYRALDNVDKYNLNYNNRFTGSVKGKYFIETFNDRTNKYELYIDLYGTVYYDSKEAADDKVKDELFNISPSSYMSLSYIKENIDLYINPDKDSFIGLVQSNKIEFIKYFIKDIYYKTDIRFQHDSNPGKDESIEPFISLIYSRLLNIINSIKTMSTEDFGGLLNQYLEKKMSVKPIENIKIKLIDNFNNKELIDNINDLCDYEFLNIFIESCIQVITSKLYRIVEVK